MSRRVTKWLVALGVLDLVVLGLTIRAHVTYHRTSASSPTVMPLGQLLGWIVSALLLLVVLFIAKESRRQHNGRRAPVAQRQRQTP